MSQNQAIAPNPKAWANYNLNKLQIDTSLQLLEVTPNSYLQTDGSQFVIAGTVAPPAGSGFMEYTGLSGVSDRVSVGPYSLEDELNGNSFVSNGSGTNVTLNVGQNNTGQGISSLHTVTTGSGNIGIGSHADVSVGGAENRISIGNGVINTDDNTILLGNTANTDISSLGASYSIGGVNEPSNIITKGFQLTTAPTSGFALISDALGNGTWRAVSGIGLVDSVTAGDATILIGGTTSNPTVEATGTFLTKNISTSGTLTSGAITAPTITLTTGAVAGDVLVSNAGGLGTWTNIGTAGAVTSVTAGDATISIGGTSTAPTVEATGAFLTKNITTTGTVTDAQELITNTTNQLVLGTTHTTTISSTAPASSQTLTIVDSGVASSQFILKDATSGTQSITSILDLTNTTDSSSSSTGGLVLSGGLGVAKSVFGGGTTDSSSTATGAIVTAGGLGVAKTIYTGTGISLPTSGGTATTLAYYQESTQSNTATGIWALGQALTLTFTRIGRIVTLIIPAVSSTSNTASTITFSTAIPTQYRPANAIYVPFAVIDNGVNKNGSLQISSASVIQIANVALATGNTFSAFTGSGSSGFQAQGVSYAFGV